MGLELAYPGACEKLALISPAASFYPYPLSFLVRGIGISFFPSPKRIANLVRWMTADGFEVRELDVELFYLGLKNYRPPRSILANVYTDQELSQIKAPALLIIGENEVIYQPEKAILRASEYMPNLTCKILPGAGHGSIIEKPEAVSQLMTASFNKTAS